MLANLPAATADPLFGLVSRFHADPRPDKIDMVIGVYRDETGQTPVLPSVQRAEQEMAQAATTKTYRTPRGNDDFNAHMAELLLGQGAELNRQATIQTVGGTGALRLLAELISVANPSATVWSTTPGYVNHEPLMRAAGLNFATYRWTMVAGALDMQAVFDDLAAAQRGDVVIIHGCCHNPTGIDLPLAAWQELSEYCLRRGIVPLIDMAYQGFGRGLAQDAEGLRMMARTHPDLLVAASCSKNMSLYRERTGAAMVLAETSGDLAKARNCLEHKARASYSMPPEHGAAIAARLLAAPEPWIAEVDRMRDRVRNLRQSLCDGFASKGLPPGFQNMRNQLGMFSLLPLSAAQMERLRAEFGVYGLDNGRINIAGLQDRHVAYLAEAVAAVVT